MKVEIRPNGKMVIQPESMTEQYALECWYDGAKNEVAQRMEGATLISSKSIAIGSYPERLVL
jgi:hypothetical protein